MRELIYTKYKLDYAYFENCNGELKEVDHTAFSQMENILLDIQSMNLPASDAVNGTFAYYYDVEMKELKTVKWRYSTEKDIRGYVESCFLPADICEQLDVDPPLLDQMKTWLQNVFRYCNEGNSGIVKCDLNQMFGQDATGTADDPRIPGVLLFLCMALPPDYAEKIVFMNQYSKPELPFGCITIGASKQTQHLALASLEPYCDLLYRSENPFEYDILLQYIWHVLFRFEFSVSIPGQPDMTLPEEIGMILRFWNKLLLQHDKTAETCRAFLKNIIAEMIRTKMAHLTQNSSFVDRLEDYREVLTYNDLQVTDLNSSLDGILSFHRCSTSPLDLKAAFTFLQIMEGDALPDDRDYYSDQCLLGFFKILRKQERKNLRVAVQKTADCSVYDFFTTLKVGVKYLIRLKELYKELTMQVLHDHKSNAATCSEDDFISFRNDLQDISDLSEARNFELKEYLLQNYAFNCQNVMELIMLAPYYLDERMPLEKLLAFVNDWKIEDFYTRADLYLFDVMLHSVSESKLEETEKSILIVLLESYCDFRNDYDCLIECEKELSDYDRQLQKIYKNHKNLVQLHFDAANICTSGPAKKVLLFLSKNIAGNPALLTYLMYMYQHNYVSEIKLTAPNCYAYFSQFLDLVFLPLMCDSRMTLEDLQYLIWMFSRNDSIAEEVPPKPAKRKIDYFLSFSRKEKPIMEQLLDTPENESDQMKDFGTLLLKRLRQRYALDVENRYISYEIDYYSILYKRLFLESALKEYGSLFPKLLKTYVIGSIQNY